MFVEIWKSNLCSTIDIDLFVKDENLTVFYFCQFFANYCCRCTNTATLFRQVYRVYSACLEKSEMHIYMI